MSNINLSINDNLNINYILERISQEEIMEYYLEIKVNYQSLQGSSCFSSFREDNNPTCNYYYTLNEKTGTSKLRFKDWNGSFQGDCFDVAAYVNKINIKTSQGFALLLNKIAFDFKIHKYTDSENIKEFSNFYKNYKISTGIKVFKIQPRPMNNYDYKFWNDINGITVNNLKLGNVYMVDKLFMVNDNQELFQTYRYRSNDPAYAYYGGKLNGIGLWKIYYPFRKVNRFTSNYAFVYGQSFFNPSNYGIITKSYKDVLAFATYNISSISVPSETYLMTKDEIYTLKNKVDILVTNFDYDRAGIILAQKYKKIHNIHPLMFTKGKYNQADFGVKDFTEYRATNGHNETVKLIDKIENKFNKELEFFNYYNYETLNKILL